MKPDLVLGLSVNYPFRTIEPFVVSLYETVPNTELCLFAANWDDALEQAALRYGLRILDASQLFGYYYHIINSRWMLFKNFVNEHLGDYRRVMISDVRDVIFQGNPFEVEFRSPVCFALEDQIIGNCPSNSLWIRDVYGESVLAELKTTRISCAGTTLGDAEPMLAYLRSMWTEISTRNYTQWQVYDQGMHNYIVWMQRPEYGSVDPADRIFQTVGYTESGRIQISNDFILVDSYKAPVIHQWDRHTQLVDLITHSERFRIMPHAMKSMPRSPTTLTDATDLAEIPIEVGADREHNVIVESAALLPRLFTIHRTVFYVDPTSGELRHGPLPGSPANAQFVSEGSHGQIMREAAGSLQPIFCHGDGCRAAGGVKSTDASATPTVLEVVRLDRGMVGLKAKGVFLCAEPDGRVTLSRAECHGWESFQLGSTTEAPGELLNLSEQAACSVPDHEGEDYLTVLKRLHSELRPKSYLEVGTHRGASLKLATCPSIAIDPNFVFKSDILKEKPICALFRMTSDSFFANHDPTAILGRPVDLAFLDGMHRCEFLLRDFANTERNCRTNSVIVMHDCIPVELSMTERNPGSVPIEPHRMGWWAGDVWRTVVILKKYRNDLRITTLDAPPTGLVCVTNLNPRSTQLMDSYADLVSEMLSASLDNIGLRNYFSLINLEHTSVLSTNEQITSRFWL